MTTTVGSFIEDSLGQEVAGYIARHGAGAVPLAISDIKAMRPSVDRPAAHGELLDLIAMFLASVQSKAALEGLKECRSKSGTPETDDFQKSLASTEEYQGPRTTRVIPLTAES